jgi:DNA-binding CsgD family transcriptional regulator/uncharacterized membrane protein
MMMVIKNSRQACERSGVFLRAWFPTLGLGCIWAWAFGFCRSGIWFESTADPQAQVFFFLLLEVTQLVALLLLSFLGHRLQGMRLRRGIIIGSFVLSFCIAMLSVGLGIGPGVLEPQDSLSALSVGSAILIKTPYVIATLFGLLFGLTKALQLFSWAQCGFAQERSRSAVGIACSFVIAGVLFFLIYARLLPNQIFLIGLPLAASLFFLFGSSRPTSDATVSLSEQERLSNKDILFCSLIIGFVWGFLPHDAIGFSTIDTALGGLIAGLVILFFSTFLKGRFDLELVLLLVAVVICITILISLFFSAHNESSSIIASACFQVSFLIVLSNSSAKGLLNRNHAISIICKDMARFFIPIFMGLLFGMIFYGMIMLSLFMNALFLIVVLILLFKRRGKLLVDDDDQEASTRRILFDDISDRDHCYNLVSRYALTERESEVLFLLSRGHSIDSIAKTLYLSVNTIKKHRNSLYIKTGVHKRQELIDLINKD